MSRTRPSQTTPQWERPARSGVDDCAVAVAPARAVRELGRLSAFTETEYLLRATLEHLDQGLVVLDQSQFVRLCNPRAHELLGLPEDVLHEGAAFAGIRAFQNARGDFSLVLAEPAVSGSDARQFPLIYDWPRPDGKTLEVRRVQLPGGGSINTFTDVTERRNFERALRESERRHRLLAEQVEELSQVDELTGVLNRRYIMRALGEEMKRTQRTGDPCSVAMMDLDFFKTVNDRFGHPAGDEVLRSFAIAVAANVRDIDRFGRYGGEEFLLVMPCIATEQGVAAVDRLRRIVAGLEWGAISGELKVTISAGVTQIRADEAADDIVARADAALYRAKNAGRNRVIGD